MSQPGQEVICPICGLRKGGGPWALFWDGEECLDMIMKSLGEREPDITLTREELHEEILDLLLLFNAEDAIDPTGYEEAIKEGSILPGRYFPFTYEYRQWDGWKEIAVGIFDEDPNDDAQQAKGRNVTSHFVDSYLGSYMIKETHQLVFESDRYKNGTFICLRAPYFYLQSWIDRDSLPPRQTAYPLEPDMSFESELYEIVNYCDRRHDIGVLNIIDYEGIAWLRSDQQQDAFQHTFLGAYELSRALEAGLRGSDLIPALLDDFCVWQTCPPDRWIGSNSSLCHTCDIPISQSGLNGGLWQNLPTEIVIEILSNLSLEDVLSFMSSCRHLHHRFGHSSFLSMLLRTQLPIPLNDVHWFLPVSTVKGEVERFIEACNESKSHVPNAALSRSLVASVTFDPDFPLWDFFRTNYPSDSMRNRRRIWRISQQFRWEWYNYRTYGYEYE